MKLFRKFKSKKEDGESTRNPASSKIAAPSAHQAAQQLVGEPSSTAPKIQVRPSGNVCQVCFHLDPTLAPQDGNPSKNDPSWVMKEYVVPAETPAARIELADSADLVAAAQNGCMHCMVVRSALDAVYPGWTGEKTIVQIFLALDLPVVVRLEFGTFVTQAVSREDALRSYGYDVPITFTAKLLYPSKPAIEAEIYRPRHLTSSANARAQAYELSTLVGRIGLGEDIPRHSGNEQSLGFIQRHVEQCIREHGCGGDGSLPQLPDRVIWIGNSVASGIRLVEVTGEARAKYIALSYCWGPVTSDTYLTDATNLQARKTNIDFTDLPPLLQDVVQCARALGIEYVWVDRLCIVQGDGGDFKTQAPKMGDIYGNATLTFAAATASSENGRILAERDPSAGPFTLDLKLQGLGTLTIGIRRRSHQLGTENQGGDYGRVSTRAWIWQERLLSARTVFFTPLALKFECHRHSVWEGFDQGVLGHSWSTQLDLSANSNQSWLRLVVEFMQRDITHPSDRLPAIDSVMGHIAKTTGWTPFWGVFQEHLIPSLAWVSRTRKAVSGKHAGRMNPGHYAPTWSWASVDGEIEYTHALSRGPLDEMDPVSFELEYRNLDRTVGSMIIVGKYVIGGIRCIITPNESYNPADERIGRYHYRYQVRVSGQHQDFPFDPDVALMPYSGDPTQPYTASVVRMPHGHTVPVSEWTGNCLVVLLARRKMKSVAILLGASLRNPSGNMWERIGISSGIAESVWSEEHVKKGPIKIG